jgi:hypothetical protein
VSCTSAARTVILQIVCLLALFFLDIITRHCEIHPPQVQAGAARRRRPEAIRGGGRVGGGGSPPARARAAHHRDALHHRPVRRLRARPGRRRREPREAEGAAPGVRGAAVGVQVPRCGLRHSRRPLPLRLHALLHGHGVRRRRERVPARQGLVGQAAGEAVRAEGDRRHAAGFRLWEWQHTVDTCNVYLLLIPW